MRISHLFVAGIVATGFAYLSGFSLGKYTDHEHKGYTVAQVQAIEKLISQKPARIVQPASARERAQIIASIWGLDDGKYEIGAAK